MKIATFNVNGVNGRLPVLLRWLAEAAAGRRLPAGAEGAAREDSRRARSGRPATARSGTARRAGTASPSSRAAPTPIETRRGLPGDPDDTHSRYIEAAVDGMLIGCLYLPNGNPAPGPKFDYKLRWFERLMAHAARAARDGVPVVLAGDYNVMPTDLDVYKPERWVDDALFRPEVRDAFQPAGRAGLDRRAARAASGRAHLHLLGLFPQRLRPGCRPAHRPSAAHPAVAEQLDAAGVDRDVRGWEKASDHAPTWIELKNSGLDA